MELQSSGHYRVTVISPLYCVKFPSDQHAQCSLLKIKLQYIITQSCIYKLQHYYIVVYFSNQILTLREAVNQASGQRPVTTATIPAIIPTTAVSKQSGPVTASAPSQPLPQSYQMAAPVSEAEITALLMASPMYKKLEQIKRTIASGVLGKGSGKSGTGKSGGSKCSQLTIFL